MEGRAVQKWRAGMRGSLTGQKEVQSGCRQAQQVVLPVLGQNRGISNSKRRSGTCWYGEDTRASEREVVLRR